MKVLLFSFKTFRFNDLTLEAHCLVGFTVSETLYTARRKKKLSHKEVIYSKMHFDIGPTTKNPRQKGGGGRVQSVAYRRKGEECSASQFVVGRRFFRDGELKHCSLKKKKKWGRKIHSTVFKMKTFLLGYISEVSLHFGGRGKRRHQLIIQFLNKFLRKKQWPPVPLICEKEGSHCLERRHSSGRSS